MQTRFPKLLRTSELYVLGSMVWASVARNYVTSESFNPKLLLSQSFFDYPVLVRRICMIDPYYVDPCSHFPCLVRDICVIELLSICSTIPDSASSHITTSFWSAIPYIGLHIHCFEFSLFAVIVAYAHGCSFAVIVIIINMIMIAAFLAKMSLQACFCTFTTAAFVSQQLLIWCKG